jgi:hypothetical protein
MCRISDSAFANKASQGPNPVIDIQALQQHYSISYQTCASAF